MAVSAAPRTAHDTGNQPRARRERSRGGVPLAGWLCPAVSLIGTAALLLGAGTEPASAQAGSQRHSVYVSALDRDGRPVEGLGADAFVVTEDGRRREILSVSPADEPLDLTLMIDNSTAARELVTIYRSALPAFLKALTPQNRVALVGLADRPTILLESTTSTALLTERVSGLFALPSSGMTLLDAMVEVSDGIRKRDPARAAIVAIFTDGTEFTDRYAEDVVKRLAGARTAVHLLTIGRFVADTAHEDRERGYFIARAPRATGGQHLSLLAPHALDERLQELAAVLTSQYEVVYARPDSLIPPETIEVSTPRDGLSVRGTPERHRKGD